MKGYAIIELWETSENTPANLQVYKNVFTDIYKAKEIWYDYITKFLKVCDIPEGSEVIKVDNDHGGCWKYSCFIPSELSKNGEWIQYDAWIKTMNIE